MTLPALFNPSNDMALAANVRQYFPPQRIRQMEADLAPLARLWESGPWGWSLDSRQRYRRMGLSDDLLPTDEWLAEVRRLSNRRFAVDYHRHLTGQLPDLADTLLPCRARYVAQWEPGTADTPLILKAPWSSSGRGNIIVGHTVDHATQQRIRAVIRQQGGIVAEPFYADKAVDFALEFHVADGEPDCPPTVQFLGLSVFEADAAGHYGGNYVESQQSLRRRTGLSEGLLQSLVSHHRRALATLPYRGPVGIDMMRLADGRVHPCVEINFRMTMGLLAIIAYDKGLTADQLLAGHPHHGFQAAIRNARLCITYRP